jgi:hypothetical protein
VSLYVYAGVLNYETVYHTSSLFGTWYKCIVKVYIKHVQGYVGLLDDD